MEQRNLFPLGIDGGVSLSESLIAERLRNRTGRGLRSDVEIARALGAESASRPPDTIPTRPAAVLVPLVERRGAWSVLLTRRTEHLANHAGQISFPGGRFEDGDEDAIACALREAEEETGLNPACVQILGHLDDYVTVTGFRVVPVVGAVRPPFHLTPDPYEVAEVFEVPLPFFLDAANHQKVQREIGGRSRPYYAMPYGDYYIWGATAGMLMNLYHVLKD